MSKTCELYGLGKVILILVFVSIVVAFVSIGIEKVLVEDIEQQASCTYALVDFSNGKDLPEDAIVQTFEGMPLTWMDIKEQHTLLKLELVTCSDKPSDLTVWYIEKGQEKR